MVIWTEGLSAWHVTYYIEAKAWMTRKLSLSSAQRRKILLSLRRCLITQTHVQWLSGDEIHGFPVDGKGHSV